MPISRALRRPFLVIALASALLVPGAAHAISDEFLGLITDIGDTIGQISLENPRECAAEAFNEVKTAFRSGRLSGGGSWTDEDEEITLHGFCATSDVNVFWFKRSGKIVVRARMECDCTGKGEKDLKRGAVGFSVAVRTAGSGPSATHTIGPIGDLKVEGQCCGSTRDPQVQLFTGGGTRTKEQTTPQPQQPKQGSAPQQTAPPTQPPPPKPKPQSKPQPKPPQPVWSVENPCPECDPEKKIVESIEARLAKLKETLTQERARLEENEQKQRDAQRRVREIDAQLAGQRGIGGESRDPTTGNTIKSYDQGDGTVRVQTIGPDGRVTDEYSYKRKSTEDLSKEKAEKEAELAKLKQAGKRIQESIASAERAIAQSQADLETARRQLAECVETKCRQEFSRALGDDETSREFQEGDYAIDRFALTLQGGYVAQRLPTENVRLGVIGAGVGDRPLLNVTTVMNGGYTSGGGSLGAIPIFTSSTLKFNMNFGYGRGEDKRNRGVDAESGVSNGVNYWDYSENNSPGVSSNGAGAWGETKSIYERFDVRFTGKVGFPCGGEDAAGIELKLPGFQVPRTYLEFGAGYSYNTLETDQDFALTQSNPGFSRFDVNSKTNVDVTDWRIGAVFGLYQTLPVPGIDNLAFSFGASTLLGYRDSSSDAWQRNQCDVRFASDPSGNVCNMYQQDFKLKFDLEDSGFEYEVDGMARLDYNLDALFKGLRFGAVYNVSYSGISQFDAPVNLDKEGPAKLEWRHVVGHKVGLQFMYSF